MKLGRSPLFETPASSPSNAMTPTDVIERLRRIDWFQFEKVIGAVYAKHGYEVEQRGGANPDGGIDLVLDKDGERTAVQCKQWKTWNLGVKPVREFLGAMTDAGIKKGIVVTLGGCTGDAKLLADKHGIQILNEVALSHLVQSAEAHHDPSVLAMLNDATKYCPKCGKPMILRTATKGLNAGLQFWGCSTYPKCRFTMQVA
jgi:restriction system protein